MMSLGDVVFTFCDTCIAKSSVVIIGPSSFFDWLVNINVCTVIVCRLETKVLNYVHEEDIMKCNIIIGLSVSVYKFRTSHAGMFVSVLPLLWQ